MAHPNLKKSRDGHNAKLRRMTSGYGTADNPTGNIPAPAAKVNVEGPQEAMDFPADPNEGHQLRPGRKARGGPVNRAMGGSVIERAEGGKIGKSGKTNINIIIAPQAKDADAGAPPPMPIVPPGAMGAPPGIPPKPPGPPMGGLPPGAMPAGMPPGMPMRAKGGRVHSDEPQDRGLIKRVLKEEGLKRASGGKVHMTAGAGSGEGRLEKIEEYGDKSHMKPKEV